jgi:hypothetical protein
MRHVISNKELAAGLEEGMDEIVATRKRTGGLDTAPPKLAASMAARLAGCPLRTENKKLRSVLGHRGKKGAALVRKFGSNKQTYVLNDSVP